MNDNFDIDDKPKLQELVLEGDRLKTLERMAEILGRNIEEAKANAYVVPSLALQLRVVLSEIDEIKLNREEKAKQAESGSAFVSKPTQNLSLDEIQRKRNARLGA